METALVIFLALGLFAYVIKSVFSKTPEPTPLTADQVAGVQARGVAITELLKS